MADYFLKLEGIDGESLDETHANEIEIHSVSWGLTQSASFGYGSGGGTSKTNIQDVSFSKYTDKASTKLMNFCASGKHIDSGIFTMRKAGGETPVEYLVATFTDIIVASVQFGGGGDTMATEQFTLNFDKIKIEYKAQTAEGTSEPGGDFQWSVTKNSANF